MSYIICRYLLSFIWLPFHFVDGFLHCAKTFTVRLDPVCLFSHLYSMPEETNPKKILLRAVSKTILPIFSSTSFMVSSLTHRFYINFLWNVIYKNIKLLCCTLETKIIF